MNEKFPPARRADDLVHNAIKIIVKNLLQLSYGIRHNNSINVIRANNKPCCAHDNLERRLLDFRGESPGETKTKINKQKIKY